MDKVFYIEPNYNLKTKENENVKSPYFIHDYEDYSIYVDLMVEVYDRKVVTGVDASDTKTIICSWRAGDGTDVSFMSGHKMNLDGKDGKFSILTTDCMDTYYGDVVKNSATGSNAQTFGIESINISYNNYSVPQVTIQFTDIRGVSLFSPEELRHNKSYNGVGGFANEDIAGSFFKCFFTFPYPRFTLMVKGFYGQPVSYELTCEKFNAKFNAATGSFGATAELVGYAYSLLNDVSLNALLAAPLSDYIGMSYWLKNGGTVTDSEIKALQQKLESGEKIHVTDETGENDRTISSFAEENSSFPDGDFMVVDSEGQSVQMPTLNQLIEKLKSVKSTIDKSRETNPELYQKSENASVELTKLESAVVCYNDYYDGQRNKVSGTTFDASNKAGFLVLTTREDALMTNDNKISVFNLDKISNLIDSLRGILGDNVEYNTLLKNPQAPESSFLDNTVTNDPIHYSINPHHEVSEGLYQLIKDDISYKLEHSTRTEINQTSPNLFTYCVYFDGTKFLDWVEERKAQIVAEKDKADAEIDAIKTAAIQDALGFSPSIYNIMKIIMAHLETLLHMMYTATSIAQRDAENGDRKLADFGYSKANNRSGLRLPPNEIESKEDMVGAWPKMVEKNIKNNQGYVDTWIGKYQPKGHATPEENVVNGLLNGISTVANTVAEVQQVMAETVSDKLPKTSPEGSDVRLVPRIKLPIGYVDYVLTGNPFGSDSITSESDMHQFYDIIAKMYYRMNYIINWDNRNNAPLVNEKVKNAGIFDAMNFYDLFFENSNGSIINETTKNILIEISVDEILNIIHKNTYNGNQIESTYTKLWNKSDSETNSLETVAQTLAENGFIPMQNISYADALDFMNTKSGDINNFIINDKTKNIENTSYDNFIYHTNNANCCDDWIYFPDMLNKIENKDYTADYEKLREYVFTDKDVFVVRYRPEAVFNKDGTFTYDYDGTSVSNLWSELFSDYKVPEYFNSNITFAYRLAFSENSSSNSSVELKFAKGNGVIKRDDISSLPCDKEFTVAPLDNKEGRPLNRKKIDNFEVISQEIENNYTVDTLTIPCMQFYNKFAEGTKCSLFTSEIYYGLNNDYAKGFLFLDNLRCHDVRHFFTICFNMRSSVANKKALTYTTEVASLLAGAYIARAERENTEYGTRYFTDQIFGNYKTEKYKRLVCNDKLGDDFENFIEKGNSHVKEFLVKKFENWVNSSEEGYGFQYFKKQFELQVNGNSLTVNEIKNFRKALREGGTLLREWFDKLDGNFFNNYAYIRGYYILMNNENATAVRNLTNFNIKPLLSIRPLVNSTKIDLTWNHGVLSKSDEKNYITGFIETLCDLIKSKRKSDEEKKQVAQPTKDPKSPNEIRTELYRYLKALNDKWLGGTQFEQWKLVNFFEKHFSFIDSYYNDISDHLKLNPNEIYEIVVKSESQRGFSLISFICALLEKNHVMFHCVQNFINLKDGEWQKKMNQMFSPIPYLEMEAPSMIPHFVSIFTSEPSSKLNIEGGEYPDDSFMLDYGNETNWPEAIKNKYSTNIKDLPIPAFGVSYGSQYQSYFNDISVGMEGSMMTEQALQAQYEIAGMHGQKENGEEVYTLGQDLFTVYANQSYTCNVTMMGCPWVQPLMYFVLNNIPLFRGSYLIQKVNHSLTPGKMTTTFTGVRMANTATPFIDKVYNTRSNDVKTDEGENRRNTQKKDKNCPECMDFDVKPIVDKSNSSGIDPNILYEENGYAKYGCTDNDPTAYTTILDALTSTAIAEAGTQDELGIRLVIAVMFSRWKYHGSDFKNIFKPGQTAYIEGKACSKNKYKNKDKWNSIAGYVEEMFVNTPVPSLIGQRTIVDKPVNIWNGGVMSSSMTEPLVITEEMVEKLYMYCSTEGYAVTNPRPKEDGPLNSKGKPYLEKNPENWRNCEYILHHKGHVFTSEPNKGKGTPHYTYSGPIENHSKDESEHNIVSAFVDALQKSVNATKGISYKINSAMIKQQPDIVILTTDNKQQSKTLFDLILNGYEKYFTELSWVANSESDLVTDVNPDAIIVKVSEGLAETHKIRAGYFTDKDNFKIAYIKGIDENSVNEGFLKSIAKHYKDDMKSMNADCPQFAPTTEDKKQEIIQKHGCHQDTVNEEENHDGNVERTPEEVQEVVKNAELDNDCIK